MSWNPVDFFDEYDIHYVTKGPNTKKGNVSIQCPFCGEMDTSQHMGVRIYDGVWGCWRDKGHRGRSPVRLIQALLGCSWDEAKRLAGGKGIYMPGDFEKLMAGDWSDYDDEGIVDEAFAVAELDMPKSFRRISDESRASTPYYVYLKGRGFKYDQLKDLIKLYNLRYTVQGSYSKRIIFPYYMQGQLITWTGRAIGRGLRYKTLEAENSVVPTKGTLYNYDRGAEGARVLLVVEGPLDVLKLDYAAYVYGLDARAVGISSLSIEDDQVWLLNDLSYQYEKVVIVLDRGETVGSYNMNDKLAFIRNVDCYRMTEADDPGDLSLIEARDLLRKVIRE